MFFKNRNNIKSSSSRNRHRRCSLQKSILKNFAKLTKKLLCWILLKIPEDYNFFKKETPTQGFSSECCKPFKNIFFTIRTPPDDYFCSSRNVVPLTEIYQVWSFLWRRSIVTITREQLGVRFYTSSKTSLETLRKQCLSAKFSYQKIR